MAVLTKFSQVPARLRVFPRPRFSPRVYDRCVKRLSLFKRQRAQATERQRRFFSWVFRVQHHRFTLLGKLKQSSPPFQPYARRVAPVVNLRCYALCAAVMRHGRATQAQNLLSNIIVLLTETTPQRSGCTVLSDVVRALEPAAGVLVYRRGRNSFSMPVPLWPARRTFLAVRFLLRGARRRRRTQRVPFRLALYQEVMAVYTRQPDCYALKLFRQHRVRVLNCESQAWRARKRRF